MVRKIVPVVMAGGAGTRLWPLSRADSPKQFMPLFGKRSTFQRALQRVSDSPVFAEPLVVTNDRYHLLALRQARELDLDVSFLLEPVIRDSGPAIAAVATILKRRYGDDCVILVVAADHVILDQQRFIAACRAGLEAAHSGRIVTFGTWPTHPRTSFGYIQPGVSDRSDVRPVRSFVEKPDAETAAALILDGYLWNTGNFMAEAGVLCDEFERYAPGLLAAATRACDDPDIDPSLYRLGVSAFATAPSISIDFGLMEKTDRASVVVADFRWLDVGSWNGLWEVSEQDSRGNVLQGDAELINVQNCLVHADRGIVGLVGVSDLAVSVTDDAVLVMDRKRGTEIKALIAKLKARKRRETDSHRKVRKSWGSYEALDAGDRFGVTKVSVQPGGERGRHRHLHRSELWYVTRGVAEVTIDDAVSLVTETNSISIPQGAIHGLRNPGQIPLELIELQSGSYISDEDVEQI